VNQLGNTFIILMVDLTWRRRQKPGPYQPIAEGIQIEGYGNDLGMRVGGKA